MQIFYKVFLSNKSSFMTSIIESPKRRMGSFSVVEKVLVGFRGGLSLLFNSCWQMTHMNF